MGSLTAGSQGRAQPRARQPPPGSATGRREGRQPHSRQLEGAGSVLKGSVRWQLHGPLHSRSLARQRKLWQGGVPPPGKGVSGRGQSHRARCCEGSCCGDVDEALRPGTSLSCASALPQPRACSTHFELVSYFS